MPHGIRITVIAIIEAENIRLACVKFNDISEIILETNGPYENIRRCTLKVTRNAKDSMTFRKPDESFKRSP